MTSHDTSDLFDRRYFEACCGTPYVRNEHWTSFFGHLANRIVASLAPRTVLDAGCAMGFLVEALRDRGVEAWGLDISEYAISRVRDDVRPFCHLASLTEPIEGRYDLIVCIEVLEHLPPADAQRGVMNMCAATRSLRQPMFLLRPLYRRLATPGRWLCVPPFRMVCPCNETRILGITMHNSGQCISGAETLVY